MNYLLSAITVLALSASTVNARAAHADSPLCAALTRFANATKDGKPHSVELYTDWGGQFSPEPASVVAPKQCKAFFYAPGKELCGFLVPNTATEFGLDNFLRVAQCFKRQRHERMGEVFPDGVWRAASDAVPGITPGLRLAAEFSPATKTVPPVLKILVQDLTPDAVALPAGKKKTIGTWVDGDCTTRIAQIGKTPYIVVRCNGDKGPEFGVPLEEASPMRFVQRRRPEEASYRIDDAGTLTVQDGEGKFVEQLQPQRPRHSN